MTDILIKNGTIVDGTGRPSYRADIAVEQGRIIYVGTDSRLEANELIDAAGLTVCPGFIDVHSHNDLVPFMDQRLDSLKLLQGVTTELTGQCGLGVVPCTEKEEGLWKNYTRGVVGEPDICWQFKDMGSYLEEIGRKGLKNNYAALIAHGAVRTKVMGFDKRTPTDKELAEMCSMVDEAMRAGAFGMSLGLQYMPGIFSSAHELAALCRVVKAYDGTVMVHLRNHDSSMLAAMEEVVSVTEVSGVRLHISHMRSYASRELGCNADMLIGAVEAAAGKGISITFDEHLYLSGSTLLTQLLPPWITGGGSDGLMSGLRDKALLNKIKLELEDKSIRYKGWDNYSAINGWDGILITSVKTEENRRYIGRTIGSIAHRFGMHPVDFVAGLLVEEQGGVGIVTLNVFSEEDTIKLIRHPLQMVGSDSIPAGVPHPRLYGNYPLFLGKYVRDKKVVSLEEAIHKCTLLPARTLGIHDIGELSQGKTADITVFDFNEIKGFEDYNNPTLPPEGIRHVILNGKVAVRDGKPCEGKHGRVVSYHGR